jgi:hypothetical protein
VSRFIWLALPWVAACGAGATNISMPVGAWPSGMAQYNGTLARTTTQDFNAGGVAYREVSRVSGAIALTANFDAGVITATVTDPAHDVERSSAASTAPQYNFIEERAYSGQLTGSGPVVATAFSVPIRGDVTLVSVDRTAVSGPKVPLTGVIGGNITGDDFSEATGSATVNQRVSGEATPLFSDIPFRLTQN